MFYFVLEKLVNKLSDEVNSLKLITFDNFLQWWRESYHKASISIKNRESMLEQAANFVESKLTLLGATAIEDQLQDQVWNILN